MDRESILAKIHASRKMLETAIERVPVERRSDAGLPNGWSVKDMLAHLAWWQARLARVYDMLARGETPESVNHADLDAINARVMAEHQDMLLAEVAAKEAQAYRDLLTVVETAPEPDLFDPQRFAWTNGTAFAEWLRWDTWEHYDEHRALLDLTARLPESAVKARAFLERHGRDIDRAMFDFAFAGMPVTDLLKLLERYQNQDGGFFGLEVDIQAPKSNPFAVELALQVMDWAGAPADHPVVQKTVQYLEENQDDDGGWRFSPEISQYPLAPWFQHWEWPSINPATGLSAHLRRLGAGSEDLHERVRNLVERLGKVEHLTGKEYYNVSPYAHYFLVDQTFTGSDRYRWGAAWWLITQHHQNPGMDAFHFLELAPRPDSPLSKLIPDQILQAELDRLESEQQDDGGWPSPYDPKWRPWVTANALLILKAYGRL